MVNTPEGADNYVFNGYSRALSTLIAEEPELWDMSNEHTTLLIKLSQQLSSAEQIDLDSLLLEQINGRQSEQVTNAVALYFIHTGSIKKLIDRLRQIFTSYNNNEGFIYATDIIMDSVRHRPDIFSEEQGEYIDEWIQSTLHGDSKLAENINEYPVLYEGPVKALRGLSRVTNELLTQVFAREINTTFNPELNVDEEKVHEAIDDLGLNLDLSTSLNHIASEIQSANTELNYRDIMSSIRAYTERLYEQIAKKLDPKTTVNGKDSKKAAAFFKEKGLISNDVADLLEAHRHFLSNDGAHRIKSRKEDLRIAKNFTIEISLYLLTRLRESTEDGSTTT